ncbi:MAG: hypothetical protein CMN32_12500 [Saprospirales bacterium]|nr:hypothetical protein [Saprospirales bacterium]
MDFLKKLFDRKPEAPGIFDTPVRFGRFSDVYRTAEQNAAFDEAIKDHKKGNYLNSYRHFLTFLNHPKEENVKLEDAGKRLDFEIYQGSRKITGYATPEKFYASSKIAQAKELSPSFMRRLLEQNFELKYSRFSLSPANEIVILFESAALDGSPYKLYPGLKEMAVFADKNDDLLIDEFEQLDHVDQAPIRTLPDEIANAKYEFIIAEIKSVLARMDKGDPDPAKYPVGYSFLLLSTAYKLDYLTKPEGYLMERLENVHRIAFRQDGFGPAKKNEEIRKEFEKLLARPKEKYLRELYEVRSTFGITGPIEHKKLALIIEQELPHMNWYLENGYDEIALAVPEYIVSHCLFYYSIPPPDKALFHLFLNVAEADYFRSIGIPALRNGNTLDKKGIRNAIEFVEDSFEEQYPELNIDHSVLNYDSLPQFARSFLTMVKNLNIS